MTLFKKIANHIGMPFGIRGTAARWVTDDNNIPHGTTDASGLEQNIYPINTIHFFAVDQETAKSFAKPDKVLKNTIKNAVEEYACLCHSGSVPAHIFSDDREYSPNQLPILYVFSTKGIPAIKGRYGNLYDHYKGQRVFPEVFSILDERTTPELDKNKKMRIDLTPEEYENIHNSVSSYLRRMERHRPIPKLVEDKYWEMDLKDFSEKYITNISEYQKEIESLKDSQNKLKPLLTKSRIQKIKADKIPETEEEWRREIIRIKNIELYLRTVRDRYTDHMIESYSDKIIEKLEEKTK